MKHYLFKHNNQEADVDVQDDRISINICNRNFDYDICLTEKKVTIDGWDVQELIRIAKEAGK